MCEILFRGKRVDNGEWVYGNYAWIDDPCKQYFIFQNKPLEHEVIPETVGQYTGLNGKNGRKIFEGDILKLKDYHHERIVYVFWGNSGSWFYGGDGFSDEYIFNSSEKEIIGNVHDNPELLGGDEK